jgi:uncharacterized membrane protein YphA (DoxX/SURF4 family)
MVRILVGMLFFDMGWYKISSLDFARNDFSAFLFYAIQGSAVDFYGNFLAHYVLQNSSKIAVAIGFLELMIGVGLVLGLAVRPMCLLGMIYMANWTLATWYQPTSYDMFWHFPDEQLRYVIPFFLLLVLGIGHAGENWGLGSLYHKERHNRWEKSWQIKMVSGLPPIKLPTTTTPEGPGN